MELGRVDCEEDGSRGREQMLRYGMPTYTRTDEVEARERMLHGRRELIAEAWDLRTLGGWVVVRSIHPG